MAAKVLLLGLLSVSVILTQIKADPKPAETLTMNKKDMKLLQSIWRISRKSERTHAQAVQQPPVPTHLEQNMKDAKPTTRKPMEGHGVTGRPIATINIYSSGHTPSMFSSGAKPGQKTDIAPIDDKTKPMLPSKATEMNKDSKRVLKKYRKKKEAIIAKRMSYGPALEKFGNTGYGPNIPTKYLSNMSAYTPI